MNATMPESFLLHFDAEHIRPCDCVQ